MDLKAQVLESAPGLTLVLGSGGARGMAHAGILGAFHQNRVPIKGIVGVSAGGKIGALYCAGLEPTQIERLIRDLDWINTLRLFWPSLEGGGLTSGRSVETFLARHLGELTFDVASPPLRIIATDMYYGKQVVLASGRLSDAVRASIALPGLIPPYRVEGRLLGDGGLVNPLPVDVARQTFGGPVVAVAVHPGAFQLAHAAGPTAEEAPGEVSVQDRFIEDEAPPLWTTLRRAIQITQAQLVELRLERYPPDLILRPAVAGIGVLEFYRGGEAIQAGYRCATQYLPQVQALTE